VYIIYNWSFQIDGTFAFRIPMRNLFDSIGVSSGETYIVQVEVEDALTKTKQNNSKDYRFFLHNERLEFLEGSGPYKPGLPYTAYVTTIHNAFNCVIAHLLYTFHIYKYIKIVCSSCKTTLTFLFYLPFIKRCKDRKHVFVAVMYLLYAVRF